MRKYALNLDQFHELVLEQGSTDESSYTAPISPDEAGKLRMSVDASKIAEKLGNETALVGGIVRDLLARYFHRETEPVNDIDMIIYKKGSKDPLTIEDMTVLADSLESAGYTVNRTGIEFLHIAVHKGNNEVEFGTPRSEAYRDNSRKPFVKGGTIEDDIMRRDFTVNAISALIDNLTDDSITITITPETRRLVPDVKAKILRTPKEDSTATLDEDPIRAMRATRFAGRGYAPDDALMKALTGIEKVTIETKVAAERVKDELVKTLDRGDIRLLINSGLIGKIMDQFVEFEGKDWRDAELEHIANTVEMARKLVSDKNEREVFILAALLHDVGKAKTGRWAEDKGRFTHYGHDKISADAARDILTKYKYPNKMVDRVVSIIDLHMHIKQMIEAGPETIVKFIMKHGRQLSKDVVLFNEIDWGGKPDNWKEMMGVGPKQEKLLKRFDHYLAEISRVENEYRNDLKMIAAKIGANPNVSPEQKKNIIAGERNKFILGKIDKSV